jgi:caffeoyl-CoA O-methyltransferase
MLSQLTIGCSDVHEGELLAIIARGISAMRVLEVGTGNAETALSIARVLPADGMLITLERNGGRATQARELFASHGLASRVSVMIGDANRYLHKIAGPFDMVVQNAPDTERAAMQPRLVELLRIGGLFVSTGESLTITVKS